MSWITPVTNWVPSPVGNADLNRIEGNLKYLREETATFNGAKTFTNNITQTAGVTSLKVTTIDTNLSINGLNIGFNRNVLNGTIISSRSAYQLTNSTARDSLEVQLYNSSGTFVSTSLAFRNNGNILIGSSTDNGTDLLQVGSNTNISAQIGYGKIGYASGGGGGTFFIGHKDAFNSTDYALATVTSGATYLNAKAGQALFIANGGTSVATFAGDKIELLKPTTIIGVTTETSAFNIGTGRTGNGVSVIKLVGDATYTDYGLRISRNGGLNASTEYAHRGTGNQIFRNVDAGGFSWTIAGDEIIKAQSTAINLLKPTIITGALTVSGAINPTTTPTSGTWTSANNGMTVPNGQYNVRATSTTGVAQITETGIGAFITSVAGSFSGGSINSNGANTKLNIVGDGIIYYSKY